MRAPIVNVSPLVCNDALCRCPQDIAGRRILLTLLLLACLTSALAAASHVFRQPDSPMRGLVLGMAIGQSALAVIWLAATEGSIGWRLAIFCGAIAGVFPPLSLSGLDWREAASVIAILAVSVAGPVMLLRIGGWRIAPRERIGTQRPPMGAGNFTFSLNRLMLSVTILAGLLGGSRWLTLPPPGLATVFQCGVFASVAIAFCFAALAPSRIWAITLALAGVVVVTAVWHAFPGQRGLAKVASAESVMAVLGAVVLRVAGYRFSLRGVGHSTESASHRLI